LIIVAAAFVDSCWERMEDANEEKLLSRCRDDFARRPMVQ